MGQERNFCCQACNHDGFVTVGGGFRNHLTYSPFPALCRPCGEVRSINRAKGAAHGCMTCGSTEATTFGAETRDPGQHEALIRAAERVRGEEMDRAKVSLRSAVRRGELTPEEEAERGGYAWLSLDEPEWHEGDHLCPRCGSYGLRFSDVTMFLD